MVVRLENLTDKNPEFGFLMAKWQHGNFYQQWILRPVVSTIGDERLNRWYMSWLWPGIGNYVPGKDQMNLEKATMVNDHRYTWSGIGWNLLRNFAKFGVAWYLFTHEVKEDSFFWNIAGNLSASGLTIYGIVASAELIRRARSCLITGKPTAQISVELTAKGLGGLSNFVKSLSGKSNAGYYSNGNNS